MSFERSTVLIYEDRLLLVVHSKILIKKVYNVMMLMIDLSEYSVGQPITLDLSALLKWDSNVVSLDGSWKTNFGW